MRCPSAPVVSYHLFTSRAWELQIDDDGRDQWMHSDDGKQALIAASCIILEEFSTDLPLGADARASEDNMDRGLQSILELLLYKEQHRAQADEQPGPVSKLAADAVERLLEFTDVSWLMKADDRSWVSKVPPGPDFDRVVKYHEQQLDQVRVLGSHGLVAFVTGRVR